MFYLDCIERVYILTGLQEKSDSFFAHGYEKASKRYDELINKLINHWYGKKCKDKTFHEMRPNKSH